MPLYLHPVQAAFFALLPLAVFDTLGTVAANFLAERQARRHRPARPRAAYSLLAVGWSLIGGACAGGRGQADGNRLRGGLDRNRADLGDRDLRVRRAHGDRARGPGRRG